jgi:hypothetical protein
MLQDDNYFVSRKEVGEGGKEMINNICEKIIPN